MNLNQIHKLMERKKTSHKGENGYALIIGGSEEYTTAPALAGLAALRCGCDSVTIAAPEKVAWAINTLAVDLITHKVPGDKLNIKNAKDMVKFADRFDAVLIGNGVTRSSDKFCEAFLRKSMRLKVVDADALKGQSFKDFHNSILTPHEKELEIMLINSNKEFLLPKLRAANVKEKADILQGNLRYFLHNNNVLLLKGPTDVIISRNKIAFNRSGNQGMTKAGTGDVLSGLAVGFLAKTKDLFKSAVAAAYLNGLLGDQLLKEKGGYSFIASDLLSDLEKLEAKVIENARLRDAQNAPKVKPAKKVAKVASKDSSPSPTKASKKKAAPKKSTPKKSTSKKAAAKSSKKSAKKAVKKSVSKKSSSKKKATTKKSVKKKLAKKKAASKKSSSKKSAKKSSSKKPSLKKKTAKKKSVSKKAAKKSSSKKRR